MSLSYTPLWVTLAERNLKRKDLQEKLNISSATFAKMTKNDYVALEILERICLYLGIPIEKAVRIEENEKTADQPDEGRK